MRTETLDKILHGLLIQDRLQRIQVYELPRYDEARKPLWLDAVAREEGRVSHDFEPIRRAVDHVVSYTSHAAGTAVRYVTEAKRYVSEFYERTKDLFYVHIPSWVKVHLAPFATFGANLFGLAYTATGDVHIREDLQGDQFSEVLLHEVAHQLYPNNSEGQIRAFVRSIMGSRAEIHHRIL